MKKKNGFIILVALLFLGFASCTDEDDGTESSNSQLQVYGQQYTLTKGIIWKNNKNVTPATIPYVYHDTYTDAEGNPKTDEVKGFTFANEQVETGNFMLTLYEPRLVFMPETESVEGKGACICFHLASSDVEQLVPGKYLYNKDKSANTFIAYSSVAYDTRNSVNPAEIAEGEVIIEKEGENYHIGFKGKTTKESEVVCQYDGILKECRVKQQQSAGYQDVVIAGLLDTVKRKHEFFGMISYSESLDYDNGSAFFCTNTGVTRYAQDIGKESVDVALLWDKKTESFIFESPIRMRSWLGHTDEYNFPCHTIYMKAPDDFTDKDFEEIGETGFSFEIQEETVKISTDSFQPGYVFFQTGKGTRGVIHIKYFTPMGSKITSTFPSKVTSPVNPALVVDVKCPANFVNPKIR